MKKLLMSLAAIVMMGMMVIPTAPVMAADCVDTAILGSGGQSCDDGSGSAIRDDILKVVVNVMTIGVGILGVLGITIVGIQYLTAGGNEEKTRKAKRRMFEIVIGVMAYVVLTALLSFLIPGYKAFSW